ncbi:hypothetical protein GQX74_012414 [Glossina fuscipes]|nr:hypothetical protein GQX74_012414 [Glossina fuscipes]
MSCANLTRTRLISFSIAAPPSSIEIQGYSNNAKVEVRENQDLTLKCIVANSKPAAQIIWFRNNVEYKIVQFVNGQLAVRKRRMDEQSDVLTRLKKTINMVESVIGPAKNYIDKRMYTYGAQTTRMHALLILWSNNRNDKVEEITPKRFTTTSNLKLKPTAADDYTEYTCQAKHKALAPDMPMRSIVQLRSHNFRDIYCESIAMQQIQFEMVADCGRFVRLGCMLLVTGNGGCVRGDVDPPGPPYIQGYTQGETLRRGQTVELICNSRGEASDNKARFRCEASNVMSQTPLIAEVELAVLFAPTHVTISGPTQARVGDVVPLTCSTAPSNPPAEVKWMVGGRQIRNATSRTSVSPEGGWITISNITAVIEPNKRSLVVICHGLNMQLTENVVSTYTVNVLSSCDQATCQQLANALIVPSLLPHPMNIK